MKINFRAHRPSSGHLIPASTPKCQA